MEQLWILALLGAQLPLFRVWVEEQGTLQPKECNSNKKHLFSHEHLRILFLTYQKNLTPRVREEFDSLVTISPLIFLRPF